MKVKIIDAFGAAIMIATFSSKKNTKSIITVLKTIIVFSEIEKYGYSQRINSCSLPTKQLICQFFWRIESL